MRIAAFPSLLLVLLLLLLLLFSYEWNIAHDDINGKITAIQTGQQ
jgi:hypothetical protein